MERLTEQQRDVRSAVADYQRKGWCCVPLRPFSKKPIHDDWPQLSVSSNEIKKVFSPKDNVGLVLGERSNWLVDVDLDCPEAMELADQYLPPTSAVTGRLSVPRSHRWYISVGATTEKHTDPQTGDMLVELRATGTQTVVGPSIHPDGESYEVLTGEPSVVPAPMLIACVQALAEAVVRKRGSISRRIDTLPSVSFAPMQSDSDLERRAIAYLNAMPPAVSGSGGHAQTYAAATAMVHGFGIATGQSLRLLAEHYNPRCEPPWSERELQHKVDDAATKTHARPFGWLRDQSCQSTNDGVDLSLILGREAIAANAFSEPQLVDPGELPEHLLWPPGLISEIMRHNLNTAIYPQPTLALAGALALMATITGRKIRDVRDCRTNLFIIVLAASGIGKERSRELNKELLVAANGSDMIGPDRLTSHSGIMSELQANPVKLFQPDEFQATIASSVEGRNGPYLRHIPEVLKEVYSSVTSMWRPTCYGDRKNNIFVDQPHAVLHASGVPKGFWEAVTKELVLSGFIGRTLLFEVNGSYSMPSDNIKYSPPPDLVERVAWWVNFQPGGNLSHEHPAPQIVEESAEAHNRLFTYMQVIRRKQSDEDETCSTIWSRAAQKAGQLALVLAASRQTGCDRLRIELEDVEHAIAINNWSVRKMVYQTLTSVADTSYHKLIQRMLQAIPQEWVSMTEITRKTYRIAERAMRDRILRDLLECGQVETVNSETVGKPGPKTTLYRRVGNC